MGLEPIQSSIEQALYNWAGYGAYIVLTAKDYERVIAKLTELELLEQVLATDMMILPVFLDIPDYDDADGSQEDT